MNLLKSARAKTQLILIGKGLSSKDVKIPEIPTEWSRFMDTDDEWINVEFPESENSSNCLYIGKKGSIFRTHHHLFSDEMMTILNKDGRMKVYTENESRVLTYGESIVIPFKMRHAVIFEEDTKIFIHWHPHFQDGWDAKFDKD